MIRNVYDWVLNLAYKPYAPFILFSLSFSESSFFPIPPDILLISLCLGANRKSLYFALICTLGSVFGGAFGYFIGNYLWWDGNLYSNFAQIFFNNIPGFSEELFLQIQEKYILHGFLIIFTAGFTPIPYKIFTIFSGAFSLPFHLFLLASFISRGARFFLLSLLIYKYGEKIRIFIDRYFNLLSIIFTIFLISGYIIIKLW